jgi:DNA-binding transcriptional MerR regulator
VRRLAFIRNARDLGFTIETIVTLLDLASKPDRLCGEVIEIAEANLEVVRERLARLRALERALKDLVTSCHGGQMKDCRIMEALSDPRR